MKQNIYDNEVFFNAYMDMREKNQGLNTVLEQPAFWSLILEITGKRVLDLGCGYGESCRWYLERGAEKVVGVDISEKMIVRAKAVNPDPRIEYMVAAMEELKFTAGTFDFIGSSLAFHYVADFSGLIDRIAGWLSPGGYLVFSQEHPIATAKHAQKGWCKDDQGNKQHWKMDDYHDEGVRKQYWFIDGVLKYHRTMETIFNTLIQRQLEILYLREPVASVAEEAKRPDLADERRRPPFLIIQCRKKV